LAIVAGLIITIYTNYRAPQGISTTLAQLLDHQAEEGMPVLT
jgi:hypothetical protein